MPHDPGNHLSRHQFFLLFTVSAVGICAQLFFILILGLKTWSFVVYTAISFALLGYAVGANLFLTFKEKLLKCDPPLVSVVSLVVLAFSLQLAAWVLPAFPIHTLPVENTQYSAGVIMAALAFTCLLISLPFLAISFLVTYIFSLSTAPAGKLYFWDLLGAALGAVVFYVLTTTLGPVMTLKLFSGVSMFIAAFFLREAKPRSKLFLAPAALAVLMCLSLGLKEPAWKADRSIGFENIPSAFGPGKYETLMQKWHPLGRTDLYAMLDSEKRQEIIVQHPGTFQLNVNPLPDSHFFCNNFRAGTPVYNFSAEGMVRHRSQVELFTCSMEVPYVLLNNPRVLVIGAGGGRDIFMAKTHGAIEIKGAEINPATHAAMSKGGEAYAYSGGIYEADNVHVANIDGRHLSKVQPSDHYDLIILNGVDTFAALSSGAYAYAENYLYTKDAITDFLRTIKPGGIINFNRWFETGPPRETLRLFVLALDALKSQGAARPWEHVIIGNHNRWGLTLIKKTPFTSEEEKRVQEYFQKHGVQYAYLPSYVQTRPPVSNEFVRYVDAVRAGEGKSFTDEYAYDISVVTDDAPFFYKYYKLLSPIKTGKGTADFAWHHTAVLTQVCILAVTTCFIILFIGGPLLVARSSLKLPFSRMASWHFFAYFSFLGLGFIFIEISTMQRLTLALGSPIYAVSVTLAALLLFAGIGSFWTAASPDFHPRKASKYIVGLASALLAYTLVIVVFNQVIMNFIVAQPFSVRVALCIFYMLPLGLILGGFMPLGMRLVSSAHPDAVAWAWRINFSFTVLGSILVIVIAQICGFNGVLLVSTGIYFCAALSFYLLATHLVDLKSKL